MSALDDITSGLKDIERSAFVSGHTKKSYEDSNPTEANKVLSYLNGGSAPNPLPTTLMGQGLVKVERGRRALQEPPTTYPLNVSDPTGVVT